MKKNENFHPGIAWSAEEFAALFPCDMAGIWFDPLDWRWRIISMLRTAPPKTNFPRRTPYESDQSSPIIAELVTGALLHNQGVGQRCSSAWFVRGSTRKIIWFDPLDWRWRIISMLRTAPPKTNFPRRTPYEPIKPDTRHITRKQSGKFLRM
jgi:hypothetical protein